MVVGRFPQNFVEDLKAQANIVQIVQDSVSLKKAGNSYKGLCPFHAEKTPSFHVNQDKGFFHCFGCGTGGDVVKFIELHEKLSFPEAVRQLAQRFGLQVPDSDDPARDSAIEAQREALLKVHTLAAQYFKEKLGTENGAQARDQLRKRGFSRNTIETLGLGYAPSEREGLKNYLLGTGQTLELLLASGLVVERAKGYVIDRFRNRLMIPIHRDSGSIIAFGGRALAKDQQPKYVNSPETVLYTKGKTLYGLNLTKTEIKRLGYAVIVEGYFDFAQALQAGVKTVVATCGTAITESQTRLLRRFASKVILSFDSDTAGQNASVRCGELLISEGFQINIAMLLPGEDPDTYVRKHGANLYVNKLRNSKQYLEYVLDRAATSRDLSQNTQRRAFLTDMLGVAARIPDAASRDQFADRLAHKAHIMEDVVRKEIRRAASARLTTLKTVTLGHEDTIITPAERGLIWATMKDTANAQTVLANMTPTDLKGLATTPILQVAYTLAEWPADVVPNAMLERLTENEGILISQISAGPTAPANVNDCGIEITRMRLERDRTALQDEINQYQKIGTPNALKEIDSLWERKKNLLKQIETLGEEPHSASTPLSL